MIEDFKLAVVASGAEAAKHIGEVFIAGGTDLVPLMKYEVRNFDVVVDLSKAKDLKYIKTCEKGALIGAMATLTEIETNPEIIKMFPALSFAAKCVASPQIRNVGTIGGNIMQDRRCLFFNQSYQWRQSIPKCFKTGGTRCHQAPVSPVCRAPYYSDAATALAAYGASVLLNDKDGEKTVGIMELLAAHGKTNGTTKTDGILVKEISVDNTSYFSKFIKESTRDSIDFPTFNACVNLYGENGERKVRIAVGSINLCPVVLSKTSELITQNLSGLKSMTAQIKAAALDEIKANTIVVREDVISPKIKRDSFAAIGGLIDDLIEYLG